jgi:T-complex protein 1 subunit theta
MAYNSASGLGGMLKQGTKHFADDDPFSASVVLRNIDATLQLSRMLSSSLGPQGRCKLTVNHLGKITVTSDCASILSNLDVEHPAAQLLTQACQKQEEECGDNTNTVLAIGGELLWQTAALIGKMTWQPAPEILAGYHRAMTLVETVYLPALVCGNVTNVRDKEQLLRILTPVMAAKQYGSEGILAPLVADACLAVMADRGGNGGGSNSNSNNNNTTLNVDSVRTVKFLGSSVASSTLLEGYVAVRGLETVCTSAADAKICIFACGLEASSTEAKGTVLMKTAEDLKNYNRTEEQNMSDIIESIANSGVKVVVTGGNVSDMALHFCDRNNLMLLKVSSKWELRRLSTAVNATALVRLGAPTPDEMGFCESVRQEEIGGRIVTVFTSGKEGKLATIVLRASTSSVLADLERAVDDGVQAVAAACNDGRLVYGGGAVEMALSVALQQEAEQVPGLEQYALAAFGKALEVVPRTLAENAGWNATRVLADLKAAHAANPCTSSSSSSGSGSVCAVGVNIERDGVDDDGVTGAGTADMQTVGVVDLLATKLSAIKLAVDAATTILKVDQIIMSKQSGGPQA